jgi:hypothetical protein
MIDVNVYRDKLEKYFLGAGFTKLEEPEDTKDNFYAAMVPDGSHFDSFFWEPAVQGMVRAMTEAGIKKFYRLDVYYDGDVLCVTASPGDNPRSLVNDQ